MIRDMDIGGYDIETGEFDAVSRWRKSSSQALPALIAINEWLGPNAESELSPERQEASLASLRREPRPPRRNDLAFGEVMIAHRLLVVGYVRTRLYWLDRASVLDCLQLGTMGLREACKTWDEEKSAFSTWAFYNIRSEINRHRDFEVRHRRRVAAVHHEALAASGSNYDESRMIAGMGEHFRNPVRQLLLQEICEAMEKLPEPQAAAIERWVTKDGTDATVGATEGVSKQAVQLRRSKGLQTLRAMFGVGQVPA